MAFDNPYSNNEDEKNTLLSSDKFGDVEGECIRERETERKVLRLFNVDMFTKRITFQFQTQKNAKKCGAGEGETNRDRENERFYPVMDHSTFSNPNCVTNRMVHLSYYDDHQLRV